MATATQDKIDPTVPLCGLPKELVESAAWGEIREQNIVNGQVVEKLSRHPVINGVMVHTLTPADEYLKFIKMFPKVAVMLPMTEEEGLNAARTGKQPAEIIQLNGCKFTIPKGVIIQVPTPLAEIVTNMVNPIRTRAMAAHVGREEFNPLDPSIPFEL